MKGRLKIAIEESKYSQTQIAERLRVTPQEVVGHIQKNSMSMSETDASQAGKIKSSSSDRQ